MKMIIGLGNPGAKYQNNRHNAGHMFVDFLKKSKIADWQYAKTDGFMNQSGAYVESVMKNKNIDINDLFVAHDDLDIPLGKFKIEMGGGPRLHNGLKSIEETIDTGDFWRIRIGIDTRNPQEWVDGETYVLSDFEPSERSTLDATFDKILSRLYEQRRNR